MRVFRISSLDYSPYDNGNKSHRDFLKSLLREIEEEGELGERLGDIEYMFLNSYQDIDEFRLDNQNAYLIESDGVLVGFVYLYVNKERVVLIYMGILEEFRSRGYGSLVTRELTDYILENFDVKGIQVQVESDNIRSLKAIKRAGFQNIYDDFYFKGR